MSADVTPPEDRTMISTDQTDEGTEGQPSVSVQPMLTVTIDTVNGSTLAAQVRRRLPEGGEVPIMGSAELVKLSLYPDELKPGDYVLREEDRVPFKVYKAPKRLGPYYQVPGADVEIGGYNEFFPVMGKLDVERGHAPQTPPWLDTPQGKVV